MDTLVSTIKKLPSQYWPLIKSRQTTLLLLTGLAGFLSARCPVIHFNTLFGLSVSLFLAVGGSTMINMWYDRDIDARMERTCRRPLPLGLVEPINVLGVGVFLTLVGVAIGLWMAPLYGLLLACGAFFDVFVYTVWLKRRTAWAILWGGISGGIPALAGRALGSGQIDWVGIAFLLGILFWIPTHIMTISIKYEKQYAAAGVPTFPSTYGRAVTRRIMAVSTVLASIALAAAALGAGMSWGFLRLVVLLSVSLLALALFGAFQPSQRVNGHLFKFASVYMLLVMLLVSLPLS